MVKAASPFVTSSWLETHLSDANLKLVDGSWYLPQMERDADAEFLDRHIPGAVRFNPDEIADTSIDLPHMAAWPETFSQRVSALGISHDSDIVVYDGMGLFSAARVWWNFKAMGAHNVRILSGGLPKWIEEDRPLASGPVKLRSTRFEAQPMNAGAVSAAEIMALLDLPTTEAIQIVDVRPSGRFAGQDPEPRPGLRSGHIPGSLNLPFAEMIVDGKMLDESALRELLARVGIDPAKQSISTCGSGITAPIFNLALAVLGVDNLLVYDGSWAEWGGDSALPIDSIDQS